jgi:alkanesulfonate monooxygenase SsuD/methylene tetrahydromethanopterin reductase-like flavin-dependent oxidoreductase (luciferase family)
MRFGFFTTLAEPGGTRPYTAIIEALREQAVLADQAGFDHVWLAEHHFGPEGMGNIPNPIVLAADLAARTSRVRIGLAAVILPWWHPIRLAEDLAVLDHLLKGRLDIAIGRGVWPREGPNFHPKADPRDAEANLSLFREQLQIIKKCWTEEFFSHAGEHYTFPAPNMAWKHPMYPSDPRWREGDKITKLNVMPKPYQKPHPTLWQVCSSQSSIQFAAENGINVMLWQPPPKSIKLYGDWYAEARGKASGTTVAPKDHFAVLRQIYVAPTMEQAEADAREGASFTYLYNNPFRGLTMFMNPHEKPGPGMEMGYDFLKARGNVIVGPPDYVVERLRELREVGGIDNVIPDMALPYLSQKQILGSISLFAEKVMPRLN